MLYVLCAGNMTSESVSKDSVQGEHLLWQCNCWSGCSVPLSHYSNFYMHSKEARASQKSELKNSYKSDVFIH